MVHIETIVPAIIAIAWTAKEIIMERHMCFSDTGFGGAVPGFVFCGCIQWRGAETSYSPRFIG
jgi:hypothetical protein